MTEASETAHFPCLLCDFTASDGDEVEKHMFNVHSFTISDVGEVKEFFSVYLSEWRSKIVERSYGREDIAATIRDVSSSGGAAEEYYMLLSSLPEDQEIRKKLSMRQLEHVLHQQEKERRDQVERKCIYCRKNLIGRDPLLSHLYVVHGLGIGLPDNIVFVDEFLDVIREKINDCQCLYCERIFKSHAILKAHMKKKKHNRINPANTEYDRFYVINYTEGSKAIGGDPDTDTDTDTDEDAGIKDEEEIGHRIRSRQYDDPWDEWVEEEADGGVPSPVCLFCNFKSDGPKLLEHMISEHGFEFNKIVKMSHLDFYTAVKVVNFIRRRVNRNMCPQCGLTAESPEELQSHMKKLQHNFIHKNIEEESELENDQYLIPTVEDDPLLIDLSELLNFTEEIDLQEGDIAAKLK